MAFFKDFTKRMAIKTIAFVLLVSCLYLPISLSVKINHMRKAIHPYNEFFQMGEMSRRRLDKYLSRSNKDGNTQEESKTIKAVNENRNSQENIKFK